MCKSCCTYIQLNNYWKQFFGLDINKNNYISITNLTSLIWNEKFTIKHINNTIVDLNLEEGIVLLDENIDINDNGNSTWNQREKFLNYCLDDYKKGLTHIVKSIGTIVPPDVMEEIIYSANAIYMMDNQVKKTNNGKYIRVEFAGETVLAYED